MKPTRALRQLRALELMLEALGGYTAVLVEPLGGTQRLMLCDSCARYKPRRSAMFREYTRTDHGAKWTWHLCGGCEERFLELREAPTVRVVVRLGRTDVELNLEDMRPR